MAKKVTAYCMKCKAKKEIKNPKAITHSNGKKAIKGTCPTCGTKVFRMGSMPGAEPEDNDDNGDNDEPEAAPEKGKTKRTKVKIS